MDNQLDREWSPIEQPVEVRTLKWGKRQNLWKLNLHSLHQTVYEFNVASPGEIQFQPGHVVPFLLSLKSLSNPSPILIHTSHVTDDQGLLLRRPLNPVRVVEQSRSFGI